MNARIVALTVCVILAAAVLAGLAPASDDPFWGDFSRHSYLLENR